MTDDSNQDPPSEPPAEPPAAPPDDGPTIDDLKAQLAQRDEQVAAATELTRTALKSANPDLPEQAFAGDSINDIQSNVANARAIAEHVTSNQAPAPPAPPATPPAPGSNRTPEPSNLRGADRVREALRNRS